MDDQDRPMLKEEDVRAAVQISLGDHDDVCWYLGRVRNLRGLGLQLEMSEADLNKLDRIDDYKHQRLKFFTRWYELGKNCNWIALRDALLAPQLNNNLLAEEISKKIEEKTHGHSHLIKQESADSALSVSFSSPTSASSSCLSQEFTTRECTVLNIVNAIGTRSVNWEYFGLRFKLPLKGIMDRYPDEIAVRMVELWYITVTRDERTWEKLQEGLKPDSWFKTSSLTRSRNPKADGIIVERDSDIVKQEIRDLCRRFMSLLKDLRKQLDNEGKDFNDLNDVLLNLPDSIESVYHQLIEDKSHSLDRCDSNNNFFRIMRSCWNFIDTDILEYIIEEHTDSNELKSAVKSYHRDLEKFRKYTTVHQLVTIWGCKYRRSDIPDDCTDCVVKLNREAKTCSVQELDSLRNEFLFAFPLSKTCAAMYLHDITTGSVTVVWLVALENVNILSRSISQLIETSSDFIDRYEIEFLCLDDHILYPVDELQCFWNACREGNRDLVEQQLLEDNSKCNYVYKELGLSVLMCAARHGHLDLIGLLLEFGAEVDAQDKTGCTALTIAAKANLIHATDYLLERRADPNIQEKIHGMCPLLIAIRKNNVPLAKLYMRYPECDLNIANDYGQTPLLLAIENGNMEILSALVQDYGERGVTVETNVEGRSSTAIHVAVEKGDIDIFRCLLDAFPEARDMEDEDGKRPVDIAKGKQNEEMVLLLGAEGGEDDEELEERLEHEVLEGGGEETQGSGGAEGAEEGASQEQAQPGVFRKLRSSAIKFLKNFRPKDISLMYAAKSGNHEKVERLLKERGADPNTIDIDMLQWTPLIWASHRGHTETVKVLLKYGADPNIAATNGFTALILASRKGNHEIVELLLDPNNPKGAARVNERNKTRGWSALMWTAQSYAGRLGNKQRFMTKEAKENRRKVAKILLEKGAKVNLETNNQWTPLMQASQDGDVEMVKILCEASTKEEINHQSKSSWSALTTACRRSHEDIIRVLVEHGADVNQKKDGGVTALHIASYKNMINTLEMMLTAPGADVDIKDEWGMTPLILAAKQKHQDLMEYLVVNAKANVNIQAEKYAQWSAIFFAIKSGDQKTVDFLLDHKAETNLADKFGHTPLSCSKGLFLQKKVDMYKHLVKRLYPPEEEDATPSHSGATPTPTGGVEAHSEKTYTPIDQTIYTGIEMRWRTTQLPNILLNI